MNEFVPDGIKSDIITSAKRLASLRHENNWEEGIEMDALHLEEIALSSWFLWFTPTSVIEEMQEQGWQSEAIQEALRCAFSMSHTGIGLGEEADLKALKYQICTTLN